VSCGEVHSQARALVEQGFYAATAVTAALVISRSSLYYRKKPQGSRADRKWDAQIVPACGDKPAYGYLCGLVVAPEGRTCTESKTRAAGDA